MRKLQIHKYLTLMPRYPIPLIVLIALILYDILRGAANDQIWGSKQRPKKWLILGVTQTSGRPSSIIHQMKAKNLRIWKLCDAGTEKLSFDV